MNTIVHCELDVCGTLQFSLNVKEWEVFDRRNDVDFVNLHLSSPHVFLGHKNKNKQTLWKIFKKVYSELGSVTLAQGTASRDLEKGCLRQSGYRWSLYILGK